MNLTLSANKDLVERMREYAAQHGSSLNQMIRNYMEEVTESKDPARQADEFARLATEKAGASPEGFRFDREAAHTRES